MIILNENNLKIQFKLFDILRFPLIIGVVLIHNYSNTMVIQGTEIGVHQTAYFSNLIRDLGSQVIGRLSVPIFFIISGALFFLDVENLSFKIYKKKIISRIKSLFIPFVFWNTLVVVMYYLAQKIPKISALFSGENKLIKDYETFDFLNAIFGFGKSPINYPFWFIRDLFILCLLAPVIYYSIKKFKFGIYILFVLWFFNFRKIYSSSIDGILFFSLGSFISIRRIDILKTLERFNLIGRIGYPIIIFLDLITKNKPVNLYIQNIGIILGIIFVFNFISTLIKKDKIKENIFLSEISFFIFAMHEPLLTLIRKIMFKFLNPKTDLELLLLYFICPIIILVIGVVSYVLLKKISPKALRLITGRGSKKYKRV